jgi:hypothetical protein
VEYYCHLILLLLPLFLILLALIKEKVLMSGSYGSFEVEGVEGPDSFGQFYNKSVTTLSKNHTALSKMTLSKTTLLKTDKTNLDCSLVIILL